MHRDVLSPDGATFTSHYGREGVEFLASRDPWFRAVNLANAPDGALYVVDMYRAVIEHPQFMPTELKTRRDLTDGNDRGRIYRIVPKSGQLPKRSESGSLANLSPADWVKLLDHPNSWQRETAARLIYERQDAGCIAPLKSLVAEGKTPEGRVRALWALRGLDKLTPEVIAQALNDPHPRVIEQAIRLAEPWLSKNAELQQKFAAFADHPDARLRFQLALSLGEVKNQDHTRPLLAKIAVQAPQEEWTRAAVLSSVGDHTAGLLLSILDQLPKGADAKPLLQGVAEVLGSQNQPGEIRRVLETLATNHADSPQVAEPILIGLGEGLARRRQSLASQIQAMPDTSQQAMSRVFQTAAQDAASSKKPMSRRLAGLELLRFADAKIAGPVLKDLATKEPNQSLRVQAIGLLARLSDPDIALKLLTDFRANTPAVRRAILDCLLANTDRTRALLDAVAAKKLAVNELSPAQVKRLTGHRDQDVQKVGEETSGRRHSAGPAGSSERLSKPLCLSPPTPTAGGRCL